MKFDFSVSSFIVYKLWLRIRTEFRKNWVALGARAGRHGRTFWAEIKTKTKTKETWLFEFDFFPRCHLAFFHLNPKMVKYQVCHVISIESIYILKPKSSKSVRESPDVSTLLFPVILEHKAPWHKLELTWNEILAEKV